MTVESTVRKQQFSLNGTIATLTFTFRALVPAPTDIKVIVTDGDGIDTDLIYTTDYTVAVNANGIGGTVTLVDPEATGSGTATVYRDTTNTQESDYDDYNQFPADTMERDLDRRTMVDQEREEDVERTLRLPISVVGVDAELVNPVAGKLIGWNASATGTENYNNQDSLNFIMVLNEQVGTAYTLIIEDTGKIITLENSSPIILTVPLNAAVAFPIGSRIDLIQKGAGAVTVEAEVGVTISSVSGALTVRDRYLAITLIKYAEDAWFLVGDVI